MPSIWLFIIYIFIKKLFFKRFLLTVIFFALIIPSLPITSTYLENLLYDNSFKISNHNKKPIYVVVLGAGVDDNHKFPTLESLTRANHGIELSKKYSVPVIFTGGVEARLLKNFFKLNDVAFIVEDQSINTFNSVENLKEIIYFGNGPEDGPLLIVTSPTHYKRSILTFKKQNFDIVIPNDYIDSFKPNYSFFPSFRSISRFNGITYEFFAITWYYFTGKI
tara:strand:- start:86 stop:748 length:663 start_codon:yes stop_codon:yes gene_type:complete